MIGISASAQACERNEILEYGVLTHHSTIPLLQYSNLCWSEAIHDKPNIVDLIFKPFAYDLSKGSYGV
jgi:hypothetical protein